jgi:HlyD family secretion protein
MKYPDGKNPIVHVAAPVLFIGGMLFLMACAGNGNKSEVQASGTIEAREVNVASKVNGQIIEFKVDEGSQVKRDDVLVRVDHESFDIQLRQAQAGADLAAAQLDLLRRGARTEDIRQGEEALRQAEANLKVAEDDAKRMRDLAAKGSVTPKQRDDAEARYTVALAQQTSAKEALAKLKRLARPEEIKAAEARLAQASASVDLLKKTIADCTIVAPVSGVVTHRPVEAGELVIPGETVLTISELEKVHLMIYLTEKELGSIKLGQTAEVTIDAAPKRPFTGRVTYISPEAEFTPKNVQTKEDRVKLVFGVKIEIPNPEGALKPGLPADAALRLEDKAPR